MRMAFAGKTLQRRIFQAPFQIRSAHRPFLWPCLSARTPLSQLGRLSVSFQLTSLPIYTELLNNLLCATQRIAKQYSCRAVQPNLPQHGPAVPHMLVQSGFGSLPLSCGDRLLDGQHVWQLVCVQIRVHCVLWAEELRLCRDACRTQRGVQTSVLLGGIFM